MVQPRQKNWFERNWKWFVPLVCLWGLAVLAASVALILYLVFGLLKTSDAYKDALARAKANPAVVAALGTPIEAGLFVSGSISVSGTSGDAELAIPISGPRGKGTVYVEARKSSGQWGFGKLVVEIAGTGERINLLKHGESPPLPGTWQNKTPAVTI